MEAGKIPPNRLIKDSGTGDPYIDELIRRNKALLDEIIGEKVAAAAQVDQ